MILRLNPIYPICQTFWLNTMAQVGLAYSLAYLATGALFFQSLWALLTLRDPCRLGHLQLFPHHLFHPI